MQMMMKISDGIRRGYSVRSGLPPKSRYSAEPGFPQNQVILQNRGILQSPDITHFLYSIHVCILQSAELYPMKLSSTNYLNIPSYSLILHIITKIWAISCFHCLEMMRSSTRLNLPVD